MDAVKKVFSMIKEHDIKFVDFRFCDMRTRWHHITYTVNQLTPDVFKEGLAFDGSSVEGWCPINKSDMFYVPDATARSSTPS